jgi:uncharacterized membrane protein
MRRKNLDVVLAATAVALTVASLFASVPVPILAALGLTLFAATGYLWAEILLGRRTGGLERAATAAGLAMIVPVLGGLGLYAAGVPLDRASWTGLMVVAAVSGSVVLIVRRRLGASPAEATSVSRITFSFRTCIPFALAVVLAAGAVVLAHEGAVRQSYAGFTQLWLSPDGRTHDLLGVTNREGRTTTFRLVVHVSGQKSSTYNLTLRDGQTWQRALVYSNRKRLLADLYRLPVLTTPYRYVDTAGGSSSTK